LLHDSPSRPEQVLDEHALSQPLQDDEHAENGSEQPPTLTSINVSGFTPASLPSLAPERHRLSARTQRSSLRNGSADGKLPDVFEPLGTMQRSPRTHSATVDTLRSAMVQSCSARDDCRLTAASPPASTTGGGGTSARRKLHSERASGKSPSVGSSSHSPLVRQVWQRDVTSPTHSASVAYRRYGLPRSEAGRTE